MHFGNWKAQKNIQFYNNNYSTLIIKQVQTSKQTEKRYLEEKTDEEKGSWSEECEPAGSDIIN